MTEVDYQLALILQHKYEQERKDSEIAKALQETFEYEEEKKKNRNESHLNDSIIARSLQEQFQKELEVERPGQNLVYASSSTNNQNSSRSLTDPSWEVIDPTPDIHNLFIAFNERFFYNQLGSVCVCWSKRMTTCAGICSYQGRGGMCSIALSEPLLKLRPRKDLVETLLHEMIHAYLFVTNNNRDRDGHGPEFHKHMNRINQEAGTRITVYHDFHDEVRLYQQHWWKCTGPCQKWKPYFGMVRRAMNRAPGPNDRWWAEHLQKCGGEFIKVKQPEKSVKSKSDAKITGPDIRKFFTPTESPVSSTTANIKTVSNNNSDLPVNKVISNSNNIFGFTNHSGNSSSNNKKSNGGTLVRNNSNTIVIKKKASTSTSSKDNSNNTQTIPKSNRIQSTPGKVENSDYSLVRNHWVNKFSNTSTSSQNNSKRISSEKASDCPQKLPKLSGKLVECPNCHQNINDSQINSHLDECLSTNSKRDDYNVSSSSCDDKNKSSDDDVFEIDGNSDSDSKNTEVKQCEVCQKMVPRTEYGAHVNACMHSMFDKIEETFDANEPMEEKSSAKTKCLACNKDILKSDLNDHLEDCMNLSNIFDDKNKPLEGNQEEKELPEEVKKSENTFNCPVCMKLIGELEMNDHIDDCLNSSNDK